MAEALSPVRPELLPAPGGVDVWRVLGPAGPAQLEAWRRLLSADERARADRFKVESAREAFVLSRGSLRATLAPYVGAKPEELRFEYGEHGKPRLGGPHAASGVRFSVAHSGRLCLHAVSRGREVGVDVEEVREVARLEALARRFFAPREAAKLIDEAPADARLRSFFRCWTRKEAYLKAKGAGLTFPLRRFEVTLLPDEAPALLWTEVEGDTPASWLVRDVDAHPDFQAALFAAR